MKEPGEEKSRKQLPIVRGCGGIEGLVFWGGALVVTGCVAAFMIRKRRKVDNSESNKDPTPIDLLNEYGMKEMEDVRGKFKELQSGITNQTPKENISTPDANEESKGYACNHHQENLVSDTEQESIAVSEDYNRVAEESPLPLLFPVHPDSSSETMNKNKREESESESESVMESSFSSSSTETDDDEEEEDSSIQSSSSSSTEEEDENSATQSTTEDNDVEKSEESSAAEVVEADQALSSDSESKPTDLCRQISGDQKDCKTAENDYSENGVDGSGENVRMMMKSKNESEVSCYQRLLRKMTRKVLVNLVLVLMVLCLLTNLLLSFYLPDASSVIQ